MRFPRETIKTIYDNFIKIKKEPSPKRGKAGCLCRTSAESASWPVSFKHSVHKVKAGMTVEAAIVLPLFLFFFINLGSAMEMIRLHGNLQLALWNVGNNLCVYGYAAADDGRNSAEAEGDWRELTSEMGDIALTYTYVKNQVVQYVGERYLEESPLDAGTGGLQFWESDVSARDEMAVGDTIDLVMTYQVSPWLDIPFVKPFRMYNRYYGKVWTGYGLSEKTETTSDMVYVTENREVYHESLECTHLKLSIQAVSLGSIETRRNEYGSRYILCSKCRFRPYNGEVYICDEGNNFHFAQDCPGLTRIISSITRKQAVEEGLRPCSRCGKKK